MAKKRAKSTASSNGRRKRRTPEELIEELQQKIEEVKQRAQAKELKQSESIRATLIALRHIDKAQVLATGEDQPVLRHALADARRPLANFLESKGIKLPKVRGPRGRKPKGYAELKDE